jgi:hypothetical protein
MTMTHLAAGVTGIAMAIAAILGAVVPKPASPPPIVIHSLKYQDGAIIQDRTVSAQGKFTAIWSAQIVDVATGQPVPECYGTGVWGYAPGAQSPAIPIAEWVGNDACRLGPGAYQALASYEAGTFRTTARSDIFRVTE